VTLISDSTPKISIFRGSSGGRRWGRTKKLKADTAKYINEMKEGIRMFNAAEFVESSINEIQKIVGKSRVISACSGGVDSTVTTFLVHKAVGSNLVAVFIDDGLRR